MTGSILSNIEIERMAEECYRSFSERFPNDSLCVDIFGIAKDFLKLRIVYDSFSGMDTDKIGYLSDGMTPVCISRGGMRQMVTYPADTIIIDSYLLRESEFARLRFTVAHEVAHYVLRKAGAVPASPDFHREFDSEQGYRPEELASLMSILENRADRLAAALIMPRLNMEKAMERYAESRTFTVYGRDIVLPDDKLRMQVMANGIGVSYSALRIRIFPITKTACALACL